MENLINQWQQLAKDCPNVEFTIQPHTDGEWWVEWNSDEFDGSHSDGEWVKSFEHAIEWLLKSQETGRLWFSD